MKVSIAFFDSPIQPMEIEMDDNALTSDVKTNEEIKGQNLTLFDSN